MMHAGSIKMNGHKLVWKTWAPLRIKIVLWLALKQRHWIDDRRRRHGLDARELCYPCDQGQETIDHIIANCPFSREVWFYVLRALQRQLSDAEPTTLSWWRKLCSLFNGERKVGMDSLFALVSWQLWKEWNTQCFCESTATVTELLMIIKD